MTISGIVLAGGRSTRMGQDKASLPFGDETMLGRLIRIAGSVAEDVLVVARPDQSVPAGVRVVFDPVADLGPLAGIAAGLSASASELNIIVACDMPLVRPEVLRRLVERRGDADICLAVVDGRASPLCAVYRTTVASAAQTLLASGERRVMALLDRVQTKRVDAAAFRDIDPQLESFISCDTPETYAALLARRAELQFRPTSEGEA